MLNHTCKPALSLLLALCLMVAVAPLCAQDAPVRISPDEAQGAVVNKVSPDYPEMARKMKLTGKVELDAVIDEAGAVESIKVIKGNPLLTGSARIALKKWKFKPIERDGKAVKASCVFAFNFTQ